MSRAHDYPGDGTYTVDCRNGCGAWMGPARSGAPDGIDPHGACPKAPKIRPTLGAELYEIVRRTMAKPKQQVRVVICGTVKSLTISLHPDFVAKMPPEKKKGNIEHIGELRIDGEKFPVYCDDYYPANEAEVYLFDV